MRLLNKGTIPRIHPRHTPLRTPRINIKPVKGVNVHIVVQLILKFTYIAGTPLALYDALTVRENRFHFTYTLCVKPSVTVVKSVVYFS